MVGTRVPASRRRQARNFDPPIAQRDAHPRAADFPAGVRRGKGASS
jgi:hypothetical protein